MLFEHISYDHAAFVIVTHLAQGWKSVLAELLQRHTVIEVQKVTQSTSMLENHAYVLGEGIEITCTGSRIRCHPRAPKLSSRPIDRFFVSLAKSWQRRALGVILSGAGSDGTLGLKTLRELGGRTFVQDAASATFSAMPTSAQPFADVCSEPKALGDAIMQSLARFHLECDVSPLD